MESILLSWRHAEGATCRRVIRSFIKGAIAVFAAAALLACGGGDDPVAAPSEASATLGAAGGTLTGPDGVQVVVPPGALTQDTLIRIARTSVGAPGLPDSYAAATPTYEFTPHGLNFNLPVTIRMPYTAPAGAAHADLFMAAPGDDWQPMQATQSGGTASWSRLSFSYLAGLACAIPVGNTDPYICIWARLGAPLTASPAAALVRTVSAVSESRSNLSAAATLSFRLNYTAAVDCTSPRARIIRRNNDVGPVLVLFDQAVGMVPDAGDSRRATGSMTYDVPMTAADNGSAWFGLTFSCARPGRPRSTDGYAHRVNVAIPATAAPLITQQPADASVVEPASATFTAAASGAPAPTVQWQSSVDAGTTWTSIAGATAASYVTPATTMADNGRRFRAVFDNSSGAVSSQGAVLSVSAAPTLPTFATQPSNQTVTAGATASFTVAVSGVPAPTLQWQRSIDGGVTWADVIGATAPTYTTAATVVGDSGAQLRAVAQNGAGVVPSAAATLIVTPAPAGRLALVANSGANTLSIYRVNAASGVMTPSGTAGAGAYPYAVAITPNGLFAYVTNLVGNSVSGYSIDSATGAVAMVGSSVNSVNPYGMAMDPLGRFVWVANYSVSTVSAYAINGATGQLTAAGAPVPTGNLPYAVAAHPSGNHVYVANELGNSVSAYSVNASTGALTLLPGTIANSVFRPHSIVVDPSGRFVYVGENGGASVAAFRVNASTGALSAPTYVNTGTSPTAVAVHPNGQFMYATASNGVSAFAINGTTGALTAIGSPVAAGSNPAGLAIVAGGTHLYVTNGSGNSASAFSIDSTTGALTPLGVAVATGNQPVGIAITP